MRERQNKLHHRSRMALHAPSGLQAVAQWIALALEGLHQRDKLVEAVALRRIMLRVHQALDFLQGLLLVALVLDWCDVHGYPR